MNDWERLGRALAAAREDRGLTQVQVAGEIGVTRTPIQSIERGDKRKKATGTMRSMARLLGWADGSIEAVLAGGHPTLSGKPSPASPTEDPDSRPLELPPRITEELRDGQLLDSSVIDLTEDGSARIVVAVVGPEGASAEEIRRFLDSWRLKERQLRKPETELENKGNPNEK
ncbi:hypothetical protein ACZ91_64825 [Streptomyces regensis]|nr:hypothetical protein ACZ91_64825 [Streptomyces regensis]